MTKAEQAIENNELHLVSATDAAVAERDEEHPLAMDEPVQLRAVEPNDDPWKPGHPDLVCPRQMAIAIYENTRGQAVIRQEQDWDDEEDSYIIISKHHLQDVIDRLQCILSGE